MFFKKKAEKVEATPAAEPAVNLEKQTETVGDFEFAQLDSSIHDQKFQTKPTTYFKDALKRFVKSRSSVVAACILAGIMIMAIVVPLADQNDITKPQDISAYLPPKWFDSANGFLDGTGYVKDVLVDPDTNLPASDTKYNVRSIKGNIEISDSYANILTDTVKKYGRGGDMALRSDKINREAGFLSPIFTYDPAYNPSVLVSFNKEACLTDYAASPKYRVSLLANLGSGVYDTEIPLISEKSTYDPLTVDGFATAVKASSAYQTYSAAGVASFKTKLAIIVSPVADSTKFPTLYIASIATTAESGDSAAYSVFSFSDATEMMARANTYTIYGSATLDIHNSVIKKAAFRYDYYDAAFGEDSTTFAEEDVKDFISKGWMTYTWSHYDTVGTFNFDDANPAQFKLTELGEKYCPIRAVTGEKNTTFNGDVSHSLTVTRSLYRYDYWKGYISKCAYPKYIFGTTQNGTDFFKIVFSGLFTSLALGVLSAVINVTVGLIWGSISGYFGGWTDIIMERFTEILGGMPWIVLMTLIVLLMGSNFWTFLLALCLTGWIGVSSETRSQFYRYKGREYVLASRTLGASDWRLIFRHILPNGIGTIVTGVALIIPSVIFSEATISYLLPGTLQFSGSTSFGVTLANAQSEIHLHPYMIVSASLVMVLLMICFNLFGNGLRDAFNPSLKGSND